MEGVGHVALVATALAQLQGGAACLLATPGRGDNRQHQPDLRCCSDPGVLVLSIQGGPTGRSKGEGAHENAFSVYKI